MCAHARDTGRDEDVCTCTHGSQRSAPGGHATQMRTPHQAVGGYGKASMRRGGARVAAARPLRSGSRGASQSGNFSARALSQGVVRDRVR